MMKKNEFYKKYANLPLGDRVKTIDFIKYASLNMQDIYQNIEKCDSQIKMFEAIIEDDLKKAEEFLENIKS